MQPTLSNKPGSSPEPERIQWDLSKLPISFSARLDAIDKNIGGTTAPSDYYKLMLASYPSATEDLLSRDYQLLEMLFRNQTPTDSLERYNAEPNWRSKFDSSTKFEYFHGTSSSELLPILRDGLLPFGKLNTKLRVPYGGELAMGIWVQGDHRGVNLNHVSAVRAPSYTALQYAKPPNIKPWTPEIGIMRLIEKEQEIMRLLPEMSAEDFKGTTNYALKEILLIQCQLSYLRVLALQVLRLKQWPELLSIEQALIVKPFGMIIGFNGSDEGGVNSDTGREVKIGSVRPDELAIFVNPVNLNLVRNIIRATNRDVPVHPLPLI